MNRRRYLEVTVGLAAVTFAGCTSSTPEDGGGDGQGSGPASTATGTDSHTPTTTPASIGPEGQSLRASGEAVTVSDPRVRASIRDGGVHVDVRASQDAQYLVVDVEAPDAGTPVTDLRLSLTTSGPRTAVGGTAVGRTGGGESATLAFEVPVESYETVSLVLKAGGEAASWPIPAPQRRNLGRAPAFRVDALEVPDEVRHGEPFEASFTVSNEGDRDARFLAEFGHELVSDTGEVAVEVPAGERRTYVAGVEPYYESDPDTVPVILDWALDRRRVTVPVVRD
jgi:hypothetical protein